MNLYRPFPSVISRIIPHTAIDYTFIMQYEGSVKPGQFFEVSLPKYGEAPISVSDIGPGYIGLTIRKVGVVTNSIHTMRAGDTLYLRGPYGNGFDLEQYKDREVIVAAGGTGLAPVKGLVDYFAAHRREAKSFTLLAGFKSPADILFREDLAAWEKSLNVVLTVDQGDAYYTGRTGLITQYVREAAIEDRNQVQVIVVGPPVMIRHTAAEFLRQGVREDNLWVSYERKMCCGVGKCGHCKMDDTYICLEGPVFNYTKAKGLFD
ncbi:nadh:cytochrome b5 reductase (cbr) [Lucifera butyrica]|uniref:Nadh:cytochrome b5 reductase (Cbr) n=1 Tax=Lucifera butyrica TaxID=1351585 RepID=A0A498R694_9FIRM|nr:anaerobic sulfite reductase subunit AsrB [Lucifera butyrica]VBB06994.1 nadh:cytochrome b5 reductase (cbr) [Lucifera butyrica]